MPTHQFPCPQCNAPIKTAASVEPGMSVRCPSCGSIVRVLGEEVTASPPVVPPPPREAFTEEPRYREDERDDFERPGGPREGPGLDGLSNEYSIRIGDWFRYAQAHWGAVVGPMIGYFFLYLLIVFGLAITCVGIPVLIFLLPPLAAGFVLVPLAQLKGERWTFGDFFGGFRQFWPVFGGTWLVALLAGLWAVPGVVLQEIGQAKYQDEVNAAVRAAAQEHPDDPFAQIAAAQQAQRLHMEDPLVLSGLVLRVIGQLVGLYFQIRCLFVLPLILDRKCGAVESIQGSFRLTRGHFWGLLGVVLLLGLINIAGLLLCLVGVLFTFPFTQLVLVAGYLLIAGTRPPVEAPRTEPAS
jgi:hypothetical protein